VLQWDPDFPLEKPPFSSSEIWKLSKVVFEGDKEQVEACGDA
jgi:hypothetical protein